MKGRSEIIGLLRKNADLKPANHFLENVFIASDVSGAFGQVLLEELSKKFAVLVPALWETRVRQMGFTSCTFVDLATEGGLDAIRECDKMVLVDTTEIASASTESKQQLTTWLEAFGADASSRGGRAAKLVIHLLVQKQEVAMGYQQLSREVTTRMGELGLRSTVFCVDYSFCRDDEMPDAAGMPFLLELAKKIIIQLSDEQRDDDLYISLPINGFKNLSSHLFGSSSLSSPASQHSSKSFLEDDSPKAARSSAQFLSPLQPKSPATTPAASSRLSPLMAHRQVKVVEATQIPAPPDGVSRRLKGRTHALRIPDVDSDSESDMSSSSSKSRRSREPHIKISFVQTNARRDKSEVLDIGEMSPQESLGSEDEREEDDSSSQGTEGWSTMPMVLVPLTNLKHSPSSRNLSSSTSTSQKSSPMNPSSKASSPRQRICEINLDDADAFDRPFHETLDKYLQTRRLSDPLVDFAPHNMQAYPRMGTNSSDPFLNASIERSIPSKPGSPSSQSLPPIESMPNSDSQSAVHRRRKSNPQVTVASPPRTSHRIYTSTPLPDPPPPTIAFEEPRPFEWTSPFGPSEAAPSPSESAPRRPFPKLTILTPHPPQSLSPFERQTLVSHSRSPVYHRPSRPSTPTSLHASSPMSHGVNSNNAFESISTVPNTSSSKSPQPLSPSQQFPTTAIFGPMPHIIYERRMAEGSPKKSLLPLL